MRPPVLAALAAVASAAGCGASQEGPVSHGPSVAFDGAVAPASSDAAGASLDAAPPSTPDAADAAATGVDPAVWRKQIIYLVMPDRFFDGDTTNDNAGQPNCYDPTNANLFHGGDIAGLRQKIPYLQSLGVTAVWSTPFYAQTPLQNGSCGYHGYWADYVDPDDGAMEPKLGALADAQGLVADLHAAGMKLILDMVVNHSGRNARIVPEHPDWFHSAATCSSLGDPNVYCPLNGLPDFAQENPVVATFLTNLSRGWVSRVMPDGIRMDTAKNVLPSYFSSSWVPGVRGVRGDLFLLAEDFDTGPYSDIAAVLDTGFDSAFTFPLQAAFDGAFSQGGSVDLVAQSVADELSTYGLSRALLQTNMIDNHDLPRLLADAPAGTTADDLTARYHLALVSLFTLPGIPQVYAGDELGMIGVSPDNRRDMPSWAWDAAGRSTPHSPGYVASSEDAFALIQKLAALRTATSALYQGSYTELWRQNGGPANVFAFFRADGASRVLVVMNAAATASGTVTLPFATNGGVSAADKAAWSNGTVLTEQLGSSVAPATLTVTGGTIAVSLSGKGAGVYEVLP